MIQKKKKKLLNDTFFMVFFKIILLVSKIIGQNRLLVYKCKKNPKGLVQSGKGLGPCGFPSYLRFESPWMQTISCG
jgi:hypothetical protein